MPVVKPVRKGAKLANITEIITEAAEDIHAGDAVTIEYRFGEALERTFSTLSQVYSAAYTPDGSKLFVGTYDGSVFKVTAYNSADYSELGSFVLNGYPLEISVKPDSSQVAVLYSGTKDPTGSTYDGSRHSTVCIYDAATLNLTWWFDLGLSDSSTPLSHGVIKYSSTGRYFLASNVNSGTLKIFTTGTTPYVESALPVGYQVSSPIIRGAVYNHDDSILALAYNGYVGLYDNTGAYPREVAFSSNKVSMDSTAWALFEFSKDESRLYLANQTLSSYRMYIVGFNVTKRSIAALPDDIAAITSGGTCAISPDTSRILYAADTDFGRWRPHTVYHIPSEIPFIVDVPELPEPYMTTDKISYTLFEPNGNAFVLFGCTEADATLPGTAYVYSYKKYIRRATLNNTKDAVGVGYAPSSIKAGETGAVCLLY